MTGIKPLKVPEVTIQPKIYIITCTTNSQTVLFKKAACTLEEAISKCYYNGFYMTLENYVKHQTLTVDEINTLFKNL